MVYNRIHNGYNIYRTISVFKKYLNYKDIDTTKIVLLDKPVIYTLQQLNDDDYFWFNSYLSIDIIDDIIIILGYAVNDFSEKQELVKLYKKNKRFINKYFGRNIVSLTEIDCTNNLLKREGKTLEWYETIKPIL